MSFHRESTAARSTALNDAFFLTRRFYRPTRHPIHVERSAERQRWEAYQNLIDDVAERVIEAFSTAQEN